MNALIIEDEILAARELEATIKETDPELKVIDILPSLKTARKWFMQNAEPDIIFMDIQLSDGISFSLFEQFQLNCPVVFTTSYDQYAIRAFKTNGVDYLLKPVVKDELSRAISKCRAIVDSRSKYPADIKELFNTLNLSGKNTTPLYKEKFIVNQRHQWIPVNTRDIACFEKDTLHYIHTFSGEKYILDFESLEEIEELLDPSIYYRANRQFIIHVDAIQSVRPRENTRLTITLKPPLKFEVDVSREKAPAFKKWFDR